MRRSIYVVVQSFCSACSHGGLMSLIMSLMMVWWASSCHDGLMSLIMSLMMVQVKSSWALSTLHTALRYYTTLHHSTLHYTLHYTTLHNTTHRFASLWIFSGNSIFYLCPEIGKKHRKQTKAVGRNEFHWFFSADLCVHASGFPTYTTLHCTTLHY